MRKSGILLPVFSLPSNQGIGSFSEEAYKFIDFLKRAGQTYWQILPLVPPGACESPYQSVCTFAGNADFIDMRQLIGENLITEEEFNSCDWCNDVYINYQNTRENKHKLLKLAFSRSKHYTDEKYIDFCKRNRTWLVDYVYYMGFKENENPEYFKFVQYLFEKQWMNLKRYANENGIQIIGDLPIYVSYDSSDVYYNKELFDLKDGEMVSVAGCPPDFSSEDGQKWGNPLYDWEKHKETGYKWWIDRFRHCFNQCDIIRVDHFRGFYDYYAIPVNESPKNGEWRLGPSVDLFDKIKEELGEMDIIAEDLGILSPGVFDLMDATGFPGMKILQFAFNGGKDNPYLPENISENFVVYTGTHDNNTTLGWYNNASDWEKEHLKQYIPNITDVSWDLAELAMSTKANMCIIQLQDYLSLDAWARTNTPGTCIGNWIWKLNNIPTNDIADKIRFITEKYNRL